MRFIHVQLSFLFFSRVKTFTNDDEKKTELATKRRGEEEQEEHITSIVKVCRTDLRTDKK